MNLSRLHRRYRSKRLHEVAPKFSWRTVAHRMGALLGRLCLAVVMAGSPCLGLIEGGEIELNEGATPTEERGDGSEFEIVPDLSVTRRESARVMARLNAGRNTGADSRTCLSSFRRTRFVGNDRISLELLVPLRC